MPNPTGPRILDQAMHDAAAMRGPQQQPAGIRTVSRLRQHAVDETRDPPLPIRLGHAAVEHRFPDGQDLQMQLFERRHPNVITPRGEVAGERFGSKEQPAGGVGLDPSRLDELANEQGVIEFGEIR
jgi:hypothetical protein